MIGAKMFEPNIQRTTTAATTTKTATVYIRPSFKVTGADFKSLCYDYQNDEELRQ